MGVSGYRLDIGRNSQEQGRLCPLQAPQGAGRGEWWKAWDCAGLFLSLFRILFVLGRQSSCWRQWEFLAAGNAKQGPHWLNCSSLLFQPGAGSHRYYQEYKGLFFQLQARLKTPTFSWNISTFPSPWPQVSLADWEPQEAESPSLLPRPAGGMAGSSLVEICSQSFPVQPWMIQAQSRALFTCHSCCSRWHSLSPSQQQGKNPFIAMPSPQPARLPPFVIDKRYPPQRSGFMKGARG